MKRSLVTALAFSVLTLPASASEAQAAVTAEEAESIAREAYVYGFPMVMNYKTIWNYALDKNNPDYKGPFNQVPPSHPPTCSTYHKHTSFFATLT